MAILRVTGVSKSFAGLKALNDVHLTIDAGGVHAIIGPNGAGKSTLLNCFVGRMAPDSGAVTFGDRSLIGLRPHEINQAGVARMFQTPEIFDELSLGLAPIVVGRLYEAVAELVAREHLAVLVVEQFAETALTVADWAAIMVNGRIEHTGSPAEVAEQVVQAYMGVGV